MGVIVWNYQCIINFFQTFNTLCQKNPFFFRRCQINYFKSPRNVFRQNRFFSTQVEILLETFATGWVGIRTNYLMIHGF